MGIFSWLDKPEPYLTVRPQDQTNSLVSHINYFDKETSVERDIITKAINDLATGKRKPNIPHAEDILKGYLFGLAYAREIMLNYRQPFEIYNDLKKSEDFQCVWQAISAGDWRDLPKPPASASATLMEDE